MNTRLAEIALRGARPCAVSSCLRSARRVGSLCKPHEAKLYSIGHVTGSTISPVHLRPYVRAARAFVDEQAAAGHPGTVAALEWIAQIAEDAIEPHRIHRGSTAVHHWHRWLAFFNRQGEPAALLATVIALHYMRALLPGSFPSGKAGDRYFDHQLGAHALRSAGRRLTTAGDPKRGQATNPVSTPTRLVLHAAGALQDAFGVLAARAAKHLLRQHEGPISTSDQHAPFITSLPTSETLCPST